MESQTHAISFFTNSSVRLDILKQRAFNLRWASVPEGVIPLTAADPDFPCAPEIADAIAKYAKDRYFSYGAPEGLASFKASLASFYQTKRNVPVSPAMTLPVDSAAYGIYIICKTYLQPGDEAIIFDPVDFLFKYSIEAQSARAVSFAIPASTEQVNFQHLQKLITPKTRMICLCNPLNPTGKVFTPAELEELGRIACENDLLILNDEIWSDIVFQPHTFTSIATISEEIRKRTITVTGFSKSYGLAGLRIGAIMAHTQEHFTSLFQASLHQSTVHGANILSQVAASAALDSCGYWLDGFLQHLGAMRNRCVDTFNSIDGFHCIAPEGCYVAWVDITKTGHSAEYIQQLLLEKAKVAVVPGLPQWFGAGAEGHFRVSFASSNEIIEEALARIKSVMS